MEAAPANGVQVVERPKMSPTKGVIVAEHLPTRDEALRLLTAYNDNDGLMKHALAVEAVMRYCARKHDADEEKWGVIGLVHDLDYGRFPEQHCHKTEEILREHEWPEEYVRAVMSHGWGICTDVEPQTDLEKTLYAMDELTGLVAATALVRPSRSVLDVKVKSVKKKWKDKAFAAGVNREVVEKGAAMLGVELGDLINDAIMGMREAAEAIGLKGDAEPQ
jgi:putative nucleotidyltransferase with HDIG domain